MAKAVQESKCVIMSGRRNEPPERTNVSERGGKESTYLCPTNPPKRQEERSL